MAACNTRHDSRQHFCRLGVNRTPNRSSMSLAVNCLTSSTRLAVELLDQHRRGRLADAAAVAVEIDFFERAVVVDLQFQADHVAAQRVVVLVRVRAARTPPAMVRVFVMVLDALLVEFFFVGRHSRRLRLNGYIPS